MAPSSLCPAADPILGDRLCRSDPKEKHMSFRKGDRVRVNLAPFIGLMIRSKSSIVCEVLDVNEIEVYVRTEPPCRPVCLWVLSRWIDGALSGSRPQLVATLP
jgi:hypothetical protein